LPAETPSSAEIADQDRAYERAVLAARGEPALRRVVMDSFLQKDVTEALDAFRASEHFARIRRLLRTSGVTPGGRVLDFGGGRGLVAAALSAEGYTATLWEPNRSPVCGSGAAERLREQSGLHFEVAAAPPTGEEPFDAVVCRSVLHHIEEPVEELSRLRELLVPGGALVASDEPTIRRESELPALRQGHPFVPFGVEETAYTVGEYLSFLERAGFTRTRALFPVAFSDYRRLLRPRSPLPTALLLYLRYRLRSRLRPAPGQACSLVALGD